MTSYDIFFLVDVVISTHTPTRGVTYQIVRDNLPACHFNSHAHEGRDFSFSAGNLIIIISTHTPTRGVTSYDIFFLVDVVISTHTPTRGVTYQIVRDNLPACHFNSHAHEGRDFSFSAGNLIIIISTHTPTRGVTNFVRRVVLQPGISTHTPTRGVTFKSCVLSRRKRFQLTRPRGA